MLSEDEHQRVLDGVRQRATAIACFLQDHYGISSVRRGKKKTPTYVTAGNVVPAGAMEAILARSREVFGKRILRGLAAQAKMADNIEPVVGMAVNLVENTEKTGVIAGLKGHNILVKWGQNSTTEAVDPSTVQSNSGSEPLCRKGFGFWYGPDLVRGPTGAFYVCEDNLGYVGGFGDLEVARSCLLDQKVGWPEFKPFIRTQPVPGQFYDKLGSFSS